MSDQNTNKVTNNKKPEKDQKARKAGNLITLSVLFGIVLGVIFGAFAGVLFTIICSSGVILKYGDKPDPNAKSSLNSDNTSIQKQKYRFEDDFATNPAYKNCVTNIHHKKY